MSEPKPVVTSGVLTESQTIGRVIPFPAEASAFERLQEAIFTGDSPSVPCVHFVLVDNQIHPYVYLDPQRAISAAGAIGGVVASVPIVFDFRNQETP